MSFVSSVGEVKRCYLDNNCSESLERVQKILVPENVMSRIVNRA